MSNREFDRRYLNSTAMILTTQVRRHRRAKKPTLAVIAPENERIFDWIRVVVPPRAGDVKPETLVQAQRAGIARAHFKRGAPRAEASRFAQHVFHQRGAVAPTAVLRP